jgi:hypothetical protein
MDALKEIKDYNSHCKKEEDRLSRIKVYEVHGQFPKAFIKDAKGEEVTDEDEYT